MPVIRDEKSREASTGRQIEGGNEQESEDYFDDDKNDEKGDEEKEQKPSLASQSGQLLYDDLVQRSGSEVIDEIDGSIVHRSLLQIIANEDGLALARMRDVLRQFAMVIMGRFHDVGSRGIVTIQSRHVQLFMSESIAAGVDTTGVGRGLHRVRAELLSTYRVICTAYGLSSPTNALTHMNVMSFKF